MSRLARADLIYLENLILTLENCKLNKKMAFMPVTVLHEVSLISDPNSHMSLM